MQGELFSVALEVTSVLALWAGLAAWQRDRTAPSGRLFALLAVSLTVWCLALVLGERGAIGIWARTRMAYLGVLAVPVLWVGVASHAAGLPLVRRVPWLPFALAIPGLMLYATLYLGPWSQLFVVMDGNVRNEGPLFYVWVAYSYALVLLGMVLFLMSIRRWPEEGRARRVVALVAGLSLPLLGNAVYVFAHLSLPFDPTPVLLGLAVVPMRYALFGSGFLDLLPPHRRNLLDELPVGLVLADGGGAVVELNPVAEAILGVAEERAVGRALDVVLASRPRDVETHRRRFEPAGGSSYEAVVLMRVRGGPAGTEP